MSHADDRWNSEDGEAPTEAEIAQGRLLAEGLAEAQGFDPGTTSTAKPEALPPELGCLVDTALRVKATAHPRPELAETATRRAISEALSVRAGVFSRARLRLAVAAAALLVAGTSGLGVARMNSRPEPRAITRAATDVFTAPVEAGAGSMPSAQIFDARMGAYRAAMLGGRRR